MSFKFNRHAAIEHPITLWLIWRLIVVVSSSTCLHPLLDICLPLNFPICLVGWHSFAIPVEDRYTSEQRSCPLEPWFSSQLLAHPNYLSTRLASVTSYVQSNTHNFPNFYLLYVSITECFSLRIDKPNVVSNKIKNKCQTSKNSFYDTQSSQLRTR